ncbi:MAG: mechanosensitive ion channel [Candidatus Saccharimonadales bacterium]
MSLEQILASIRNWSLDHGWRIVLILFAASVVRRFGEAFLGKLIQRSIQHSERFENDRDRKLRADTLISLIGSIIKVIIWIVIALLVLSELGVLRALAPILAGALAVGGVLSLLLGFGIQTFVKDFISGIFIVVENQYRVGDVVSLTATGGDIEGTVIRITLRTTVLRDNDGAIHFVPNGNINRAANQTLDYAKVNIELTLPLNADFDKAEREIAALGLAMGHEDLWQGSIVQAPYYHGVQTFDKDHVTVEVRAKTIPAEQWRISSELQKRLAKLVSNEDFFTPKKKPSKRNN